MPIAQLSIDLVAKMADFEKDLKRGVALTESQSKAMGVAMEFAKGAAIGLTGALSVAAVTTYAKAIIDSVDALNDLADATGTSIENASALEDIAARTGASMDTVTAAMIKFNSTLKDAKPGSDAHAALTALNLDINELKNLDPAEALLKTATALAGFADDGHKARITQELFGKSLKEVAPFLKDLAEKGALVATVTSEQAAEAEKFNKQLFAMQKNVQDLSREIAGPLVKAFNDFIDRQKEAKTQGKFGLFTSLKDVADAESSRARTGSWGDPVGNAGRGYINPALIKPSLSDLPDTTKKTAAQKDQKTEADRYLESLQKQIEKSLDLNAVQTLGFEINAGHLGKMNAAMQDRLVSLALELDANNKLTQAAKENSAAIEEFFAQIDRQDKEKQTALERLYAATPTKALEAQQKDMQALATEFEQGRISEQLYLEAVTARLDLTASKTDKAQTAAEKLGLTFASAFEDAIVSGKDLGNVIDGLIIDMGRMVVRQAVTEPMANYFSSMIGSFLPSFAVGTNYVPQDMIAQIHKGEKIVPAAQNSGSASQAAPIYVTQYFTVGDVASVSMVRQAVAGSERRIAASISRSMTYGGALS